MGKKKKRINSSVSSSKAGYLSGKTPYIILAIVCALVYFQSIYFDFTYLDDDHLVLNNYIYNSDLSNITDAFKGSLFAGGDFTDIYYRPVMTVSLILDAQIGGESLVMYHITNIFLHLAAACLVFWALTVMNVKKEHSFWLAMLFAVQPVFAQAVAWVPGRNDPLLAAFALASFAGLVLYVRDGKMKYLVMYGVFLALAVFTKEQAFALIILSFLYIKMYDKQDTKKEKHNDKSIYYKMAGVWVGVCILWWVMRSSAVGDGGGLTAGEMSESFIFNLPYILQSIGKFFFPVNLSVLPTVKGDTLLWGVIAIALISVLLYYSRDVEKRRVVFGSAWFLLFILPTLLVNKDSFTQDHRIYLPAFGLLLVLSETLIFKKFDFSKKEVKWTAGGVIILYAVINFNYSGVFKDRESFWANAVKNSPGLDMARFGYAYTLQSKGEIDKAMEEYRKTLEINSGLRFANNNLGYLLMTRQKPEEAEHYFMEEIKANPENSKVYLNLGILYSNYKEYAKAETYLLKSAQMEPDNLKTLRYLVTLYYNTGNGEKGRYYVSEVQKRGETVPQNILKAFGLIN